VTHRSAAREPEWGRHGGAGCRKSVAVRRLEVCLLRKAGCACRRRYSLRHVGTWLTRMAYLSNSLRADGGRMPVAVKEFCPVSSSLLGRMFRSSPEGLAVLVRTVPSQTRAALAVYCSRQASLVGLAVAIAATCNESELSAQAGDAGRRLFAAATQADAAFNEGPRKEAEA